MAIWCSAFYWLAIFFCFWGVVLISGHGSFMTCWVIYRPRLPDWQTNCSDHRTVFYTRPSVRPVVFSFSTNFYKVNKNQRMCGRNGKKEKTKNENLFIFHQNKTQKTSGKVEKKKKKGRRRKRRWMAAMCCLAFYHRARYTHTHERERRKKDVCARQQWRRLCLIPAGEEWCAAEMAIFLREYPSDDG